MFIFNPFTGNAERISNTASSILSSHILPSVGTISASSTGLIESIPYTGFFSVRYFVALQSASGKTASFDYAITKNDSGGVLEAVFGKIFGGLDYNVLTSVVSGNVEFTIQNNELTTMTWKVQKLGF